MDNFLNNIDQAFDYRNEFSVDKKLLKKRYHKLLRKKSLSQDDQEELAVCEWLIMALKGKPTDSLIGFDDKGLYVKW